MKAKKIEETLKKWDKRMEMLEFIRNQAQKMGYTVQCEAIQMQIRATDDCHQDLRRLLKEIKNE